MRASGLAVGILASNKAQLSELNRLVLGAGHHVAARLEQASTPISALPRADVWLLQLGPDADSAQQLVSDLDDAGIAVIVADEEVPPTLADLSANQLPEAQRLERARRLAVKLAQFVKPNTGAGRRAKYVWVLAASTGGPEAVAGFLNAMGEPPSGVALIYAQHIDPNGMEHLRRMLGQFSGWHLPDLQSSQRIREKSIYVASPEFTLDILQPGLIVPSTAPWGGRYTPSINQVIAKVARVYGSKGGAIIFSGMGDDGAQGCQLLHHLGGQVWAQHFASCAIDSMPQSAAQLGCVQWTGTPQQLASHFVSFHLTAGTHPAPVATLETLPEPPAMLDRP